MAQIAPHIYRAEHEPKRGGARFFARKVIPDEVKDAFINPKTGKPRADFQRWFHDQQTAIIQGTKLVGLWEQMIEQAKAARRPLAASLIPASDVLARIAEWKPKDEARHQANLFDIATSPHREGMMAVHLLHLSAERQELENDQPRPFSISRVDEAMTEMFIPPGMPGIDDVREVVRQVLLDINRRRSLDPFGGIIAVPPIGAACSPYTWQECIDGWRAERKPTKRTYDEWCGKAKKFVAVFGYDDMQRVTVADAEKVKVWLVDQGYSDKTIENYLIVARRLFRWAKHKLPINPFSEIEFKVKDDPSRDIEPFSDEEARAILLKSRMEEEPHKRWATWVQAFTGCRLDEVCGALAGAVRPSEGVPCFHFLPKHREPDIEGRTNLKNRCSNRSVPLHPALIEEGFLEYVATLPKDGPLFPNVTPDRYGKRSGNGGKQIRRMIRDQLGITDPQKSPNHSWRHRFKDQCDIHGVPLKIGDFITGHAPRTEGERYGSKKADRYPSNMLLRELRKLPSPLVD